MDVNFDDAKGLFGWIASMITMAVAWFCRDILHAQKRTDENLHKANLDLATHKLDVAQNYQTKQDAVVVRNEYREELKRVHERLDSLPKEIADSLQGLKK